MANSANYIATKEDSRPFRTDQDTRANVIDEAAVASAAALAAQTTARARYNGVVVTPATATVTVAAPTQQLTAVVEAGVDAAGVTWVSSDPGVATVDASGLVTRVANGTARITATSVEHPNLTGYADITATA